MTTTAINPNGDQAPRREIDAYRAAKMLKVSRMTIIRYLEEGVLEGYRYHERGRWIVFLDSVERVINKRNGGQ